MNVERLQQLRRVVEAAPDHRFHMRAFSERSECGTAYCAAGWMALDQWFRENTEVLQIFDVFGDEGDKMVDPLDLYLFKTMAFMFGISVSDSISLFGYGMNDKHDPHAVSKSEVIANIDRILAGKRPLVYEAIRKSELV